ncbi:response regulator transcription factor [Alteromonas stellipolaris]|jgi:DNA-binding NarL/FixJ family response regulator|uniref:response regulator transcription factor n=1 Tax=Alteromonas TaxID=226 RepID=UPI0007702191|nr:MULTISPECIES: response regulator transcription factor [Alteromonas]AMJ92038.1 LuxR family transcriptional regulator [Alteromonas sp. Mac2]AMJ88175.1 LuxR family transcriptional regulator [Alteromonas sp. Mac1]AMJ95855.1 LuxR family transcriptional regulator [Alteromonas stellipolaris]ANB25006.1 DNA-binding response regulator [Alteromonas stellipolaris]MCQ8850320.1 response regulator transcription factor [Alteromonas stellipolaris]
MTTLLIADDHPLYRDALRGALSLSLPALTLSEAGDLTSTVDILNREDIDLLLLDLHMPGSNDLFGLIHIRKLFPDVPVAVVSGTEDTQLISKIMSAGALGFIPKTASSGDIANAVQAILDGDVWLPPNLSDSVDDIDEAFSELVDHVASLTPSQYKVLCFMRDGLLNKQIGYNLDIAEATVKAHVTAIFKKLGINNRTQAVLIASQLELEPPATSDH